MTLIGTGIDTTTLHGAAVELLLVIVCDWSQDPQLLLCCCRSLWLLLCHQNHTSNNINNPMFDLGGHFGPCIFLFAFKMVMLTLRLILWSTFIDALLNKTLNERYKSEKKSIWWQWISAFSGTLLTIQLRSLVYMKRQLIKYQFQGLKPILKCSGFNGLKARLMSCSLLNKCRNQINARIQIGLKFTIVLAWDI